jgi:hypothetical protein
MKCPGQDRGYWSGDRVFELPCPGCGSAVEFFRDESTRRCGHCGYRLNNPRVSLDCASWCEQAESCMGISRSGGAVLGQGETALSGRLIHALEDALGNDSARLSKALLVFQHAKELASAAGIDPRVVLPAALLLEIGEEVPAAPIAPGLPPRDATGAASTADGILSGVGLDGETIGGVCSLLAAYRARPLADTVEEGLLNDARWLARLTEEGGQQESDRLEAILASEFRTEAGKARARSLFLHAPPANS